MLPSVLLSLAPSLSPPLSLTPLISRVERVTRYWPGVGEYPVQNQGVLGWSKAELGLHKGSHLGLYKPPDKCFIHCVSKGPLGGND